MNGKKSWALVVFHDDLLRAVVCHKRVYLRSEALPRTPSRLALILVKTGPVAALGLPDGWGIQDTFSEANESGGINGRKIDFIWEDDQFKTPQAISAFNKLIFRDKVLKHCYRRGNASDHCAIRFDQQGSRW